MSFSHNAYTVKFDAFEGPLELLLELIEKEKLDISDISLARITDEFLGYLSRFEEKNPASLADFLVVAAKLILIKSKTLLPSFEVTQEEENELTQLKEKLVHYQKIRAGSCIIAAVSRKHRIAYHRSSSLRSVAVFWPPEGVGVQTLKEHFVSLKRAREAEDIAYERQGIKLIVSFEEKVKDIKARLTQNLEESFSAMYDASAKINVIIAFLAILELVKQRYVKADQEEMFGEIRLVRVTSDTS
ncbi:segregation/condensation protein A [Candidatus Azambacteria bacterium]|nr:segregation/condensation protein A [Candidatus Azambacteria bacterium]MBI3685081.1 segregation/condensation protein A [Candidatus Azambacteria bacterium]